MAMAHASSSSSNLNFVGLLGEWDLLKRWGFLMLLRVTGEGYGGIIISTSVEEREDHIRR